MLKNVIERKFQVLFFVLIFSLLFFQYFQFVKVSNLLMYDDSVIILKFKEIHHFSQYWDRLMSGDIVDRQPLRDFSFWLEYQIYYATGWFSPQITNLILWCLCLLVGFAVSKSFLAEQSDRFFAMAVIAFHPLIVPSIAWGISRKHMGAALCLLIAIWILLQSRSRWRGFFVVFWYLCSVLFQPIYMFFCLFPLVFFTLQEDLRYVHWKQNLFKTLKKHLVFFVGLAAVFLLCFLINYQHYFVDFERMKVPKFIPESLETLQLRFYVMGRYFLQLVFPFYATTHSYDGFLLKNLIGFIALFLSIIIFAKSIFQKDNWMLIFLMCLGVGLMTFKLTVHLGWDTYTPLWLIFGVFLIVKIIPANFKKIFLQIPLVAGLFLLSTQHVKNFYSDLAFWQRAYATDPTSTAVASFAKTKLLFKQIDQEFFDLVQELESKYPNQLDLPYLRGAAIYYLNVSTEEKYKLFREHYIKDVGYLYSYSLFLKEQKDYSRYNDIMVYLFDPTQKPAAKRLLGADFQQTLSPEWKKFCLEMKKTEAECGVVPSPDL